MGSSVVGRGASAHPGEGSVKKGELVLSVFYSFASGFLTEAVCEDKPCTSAGGNFACRGRAQMTWVLIAVDVLDKTREVISVHLTLKASGEKWGIIVLQSGLCFEPAPASGLLLSLSLSLLLLSGMKSRVTIFWAESVVSTQRSPLLFVTQGLCKPRLT